MIKKAKTIKDNVVKFPSKLSENFLENYLSGKNWMN